MSPSDHEDENDPDGQFAFRRKKHCNYYAVSFFSYLLITNCQFTNQEICMFKLFLSTSSFLRLCCTFCILYLQTFEKGGQRLYLFFLSFSKVKELRLIQILANCKVVGVEETLTGIEF